MILLLLGTLALSAVNAQTSDQHFTIAGQLVDARSNSPIPFARVFLDQGATEVGYQKTGSDGRFRFQVDKKALYGLSVEYRGSFQRYGMRSAAIGFGINILTGPDQETSNLVFRWFPRAAIHGKVSDVAGEPVPNAQVQLIYSPVLAGKRTLRTLQWKRTDDRGEYRFHGVPAGRYFLIATAESPDNQGAYGSRPKQSMAYYPEYLPGPPTLVDNASPLVVSDGAEVRADFTMRQGPGTTVIVKLPSSQPVDGGSNLLSLTTEVAEGIESYQEQSWAYGDGHTFAAVPPGRYIAKLRQGTSLHPMLTEHRFSVGGGEMTVEFPSQKSAGLSGTVKLPEGKPLKRVLGFRLMEERNRWSYLLSVTGGAAPTFAADSITPGRYRLTLFTTEGFYVSAIKATDARVENDGLLELPEGVTATVGINLAYATGRVTGVVVDAKDRPMPGMLVLLRPKRTQKLDHGVEAFQTDSDGSFDFKSIPVGDYELIAVDDFELEYAKPAALLPYLKTARPLKVSAGETVDVQRFAVTAQ